MTNKPVLPAIHGPQHRKDGSDPIWPGDPIFFDFDNQGGWLWVVTNDSTDIDYGELGLALVDRSEFGLYLRAENDDNTEFVFVQLESDGITAHLSTGGSLIVEDESNNPIFKIDNDGTVHIKTGSSIVADL